MPQFRTAQSWSPQHVSQWISGLHPLAKQHAGTLLRHNSTGATLMSLTWTDLDKMLIVGMYDQEALLSAISILRDVDQANKGFLMYPLADRTMSSAREALEHITHLKMDKRDWGRKQELYMSCINCGNLTRNMLLHMDKYHIVYSNKTKLAHELLCSLYSISHAAQQLKYSLRAVGIHVPDIPQEFPYNMRNGNFASCLQASLMSLIENTAFIKESSEVKSRGCPSFERITLQPDGDTGWGFSFRETSSGIYIVKRILTNTPADKSGRIKSGDEVIEVNDQNIVGWKIKNVVELIRSHPSGLVMVVRHYPDNSQESETSSSPPCTLHTPPRTLHVTPRTLHVTPRHHHVSGTCSEPAPGSAVVVDTPKKPPRPLDSVLRERCKSNNELDKHFKTVHNPKRLSQIYGDKSLFLSFEDMSYPTCTTSPPSPRGKRTNPTPPAHHRRNSSNPLDKYNIVNNRDWLDSIKQRGEKCKTVNKYGTSPHIRSSVPPDFLNMSMPDIAISTESVQTVDKATGSDEHMDVVNNLAAYCDKKLDNCDKMSDNCDKMSDQTSIHTSSDVENDRNEDNESIATTPSTISNCTSVMTNDTTDSIRSKTLPRRNKTAEEDFGQFKDYPVHKESNYTACVIGGVVHKIPVPTAMSSEEENSSYSTMKSRKRQNKRSSWSISSDKAATLPKNIRFSLADLDENGTLKKKKNKKPSRSTSSILGDVNVSCKSLYPNACEGWLLKLGGSGLTPRNWRRRWFVLKGFCLYYFKTPQDTVALGVITLPSFNIATAHEVKKKFAFKAYHKNTRTYYFISENDEEKQRWMDKMLLASILYDESDKESGYGTGASPVATDICSLTIEQSIMSPCSSLQSIGSTTVV